MKKLLQAAILGTIAFLLCGFFTAEQASWGPLPGILAAAFLAALATGGFFFFQNKKLKREINALSAHTEALETRNATLKTIVVASPDIIFVKDLQGTFIECSEKFAEWVNVPRHEIIGQNDETLFGLSTDIYKAYLEADLEVANSRRPKKIEESIYSPHFGISRLFETAKVPLLKGDEVIGVMGFSRDITERVATRKTLENILDGMDAYLYVSDAETDDILFINQKMAAHFGLPEDHIGQKCWKLLQSGFSERCSFCPMHKLSAAPDEVIVWEEHNTVTGRIYKNTDCLIEWTDGKRAHLQHSVDITELKQRLAQQEFMSAMSQNFISNDDIKPLVEKALQMTGQFTDVSRIRIAVPDFESGKFQFPFEWLHPDQPKTPPVSLISEILGPAGLAGLFTGSSEICLAVEDTSADARFSSLAKSGIRALLWVPLYIDEELRGVLSFEDCREARAWTESEKQLFRLVGNVIAGAINRSHTEEDLLRMSAIVDSSPHFICYLRADGSLAYANEGVSKMSGYSHEEIMREGIKLLCDHKTMRYIRRKMMPKVLAEKRIEFTVPLTRKDGRVRMLKISGFTIGGEEKGLGAIGQDVTAQMELERALLEAKEQAELSSRAKGDFLSRMSHEMRTPMNAIIGMTSIGKASGELERKDYCLDKIDGASKHLLGVINDVLDMSKIEAGKFELFHAEFQFERMLQKIVDVISFRVDEKKQHLTVHVDKKIPWSIVSDEQHLAQVITNLLSNAVKFTADHGTVSLAADLVKEQGDSCVLRITITDTGIGISEEQQKRLFNSFEQADGGISRRFGGTGLGLVISKNIVELMGGEIWVESEEGQGSSFIFTVQVQKGTLTPKRMTHTGIDWEALRILAVDDAGDVLEYFRNLSELTGFRCDTAKGGMQALELFAAGKQYDIVFVDWKMPGMDGIELAGRIKQLFGEHTVVVMISAFEWSQIESAASLAGVKRFIPKPLFSSAIVDCITECAGGRACEEASAGSAANNRYAEKTVLLAEDVDINREIVITMLADTGVTIECAENGRQAFHMFQNAPGRYDLILMDIHMPEVDGLEATRMIRALETPEARSVPIIAMTANVFREDVERCLKAGMDNHVGKPIDITEVQKKMDLYLRPESILKTA